MTRRVFYSFHYDKDAWRTSQVRNIGKIEGNKPATDNYWEEVKKGGDKAIQKWIDEQLYGRTCTIVLIGKYTAGRKWINYEIEKSWKEGKGIFGIYIHHLKNEKGEHAVKGKNPFDGWQVGGEPMSSILKSYDPPSTDSKEVYAYISEHIEDWIEEAIDIRNRYST